MYAIRSYYGVGYKSEASGMLKLGLDMTKGLNSYPTLDSEIEIMLSWAVAEKVARELGLDWEVDREAEGVRNNFV